jgi:membrane protein YqaA with SNARE-associated domain
MSQPNNELPTSKKSIFSNKKVFFALIFLVSTIGILLPLFFKEQLETMESFGLLGVFLINFFSSATIFLPSPGILSVPVASQIYNPLLVLLLGSIGSSLGELVGFLFGHSSVRVLDANKHKLLFHLNRFIFEKYGIPLTIVISAIPNPIVDGLGILAGMAGFKLHKFLIAVFIGRIIRNVVLVFLAGGF